VDLDLADRAAEVEGKERGGADFETIVQSRDGLGSKQMKGQLCPSLSSFQAVDDNWRPGSLSCPVLRCDSPSVNVSKLPIQLALCCLVIPSI
jgi:hypothetical protein